MTPKYRYGPCSLPLAESESRTVHRFDGQVHEPEGPDRQPVIGTVFPYLNKMIFNPVFRVATLAIFHDASISQLLAECYPPERRGF